MTDKERARLATRRLLRGTAKAVRWDVVGIGYVVAHRCPDLASCV
jgi:hypothetical protein